MHASIGAILKSEGFVRDCAVIEQEPGKKALKVILKYVDGESVIHEIKRVSTPGRRHYVGAGDIRPVIGGLGVAILTTNRGIISNKKAKEYAVGGEVICTVW
jgi:small subunit ribosomal protein S8